MRQGALEDRLEAIAGAPEFQAGDASEGYASGPLMRDPFDGITLMMVYDASGTESGNYANPMGVGDSVLGGFRKQTGASGSNSIRVRMDFLDGATNVVGILSGGRVGGRHVFSTRTPDGLEEVYLDLNGRARASSRATTTLLGGGIPTQAVFSNAFSGDIVRVAAFAWPRCLTDQETVMLHHWMMQRWGITPPP